MEDKCVICEGPMQYVGYGDGTCPHCGAENKYDELVTVALDAEMKAAIKAILLARKSQAAAVPAN